MLFLKKEVIHGNYEASLGLSLFKIFLLELVDFLVSNVLKKLLNLKKQHQVGNCQGEVA
jgi:hypothetical protein